MEDFKSLDMTGLRERGINYLLGQYPNTNGVAALRDGIARLDPYIGGSISPALWKRDSNAAGSTDDKDYGY